MSIQICSTCATQYHVDIRHEDDPPGHHWPRDSQPLQFPCGHVNGTYDTEHETVSFRLVEGERTIVRCAECGHLQFTVSLEYRDRFGEVCESCSCTNMQTIGVIHTTRRIVHIPHQTLESAQNQPDFLNQIKGYQIQILG